MTMQKCNAKVEYFMHTIDTLHYFKKRSYSKWSLLQSLKKWEENNDLPGPAVVARRIKSRHIFSDPYYFFLIFVHCAWWMFAQGTNVIT